MRLAYAMLAALMFGAYPAVAQTPAIERAGAFPLGSLTVEPVADGAYMHGAVCRRGFSAGRPRYVQVERISGEIVVETSVARMRGSPGYRGGCGFFALTAPGLEPGQHYRISATTAPPTLN